MRLHLTFATSHYDHLADLMLGRVPVDGIELTCLDLPVEEIFFRMFTYRDFDLSEVSMAKFTALAAREDSPFVGIPVFPSRVPRHSSIYVRRDGPVKVPADLAGKRVGVPEWAQTAAVYSRGLLQHHYGVDLAKIEWVQAGVDEPGRREKVALTLPPGVRCTPAPDKSLSGMLVCGEIDAALSAHPPRCFEDGHPAVKRLFEDYLALEQDYVRNTGILPIMHTIAIRREIVDKHPWVAMNLYKAFEESKRRAVARALSPTTSALPMPWGYEIARRLREEFGELMPYGIAANRVTLDAFLQYAFEQGVCPRRMTPEELFAPQVQASFKV